jgi:TonB family protein
MRSQILQNWDSRQGAAGVAHLRFVIQKDGRIVDITVQSSSGVQTLDLFARRALMLAKLPPLPSAYTEPALAVHLFFEYQR